jgi:ATP-dependent RNA helicase HelY
LTAADFTLPPAPIGSVELPSGYAPQRREYRREVGRRVREARITPSRRDRAPATVDGEVRASPMHPAEADPHLRDRMRAAAQADRVQGEIAAIEEKVRHRNQSLSAELDSVLQVLSGYGYVDLPRWQLTEAGEMLARTFHESDLLVAECVRQGLLDGLSPSELAGVASVFVHEHRSPDDPPRPWFPSADVRRRWIRIAEVSDELVRAEIGAGLAEHRAPDPGFIAVAYAWVAGEGFAAVVEDEELTGGDFVREMKQLIDLLSQIAIVAPDTATRSAASRAADAAFRGVVADSSSPTSTAT